MGNLKRSCQQNHSGTSSISRTQIPSASVSGDASCQTLSLLIKQLSFGEVVGSRIALLDRRGGVGVCGRIAMMLGGVCKFLDVSPILIVTQHPHPQTVCDDPKNSSQMSVTKKRTIRMGNRHR